MSAGRRIAAELVGTALLLAIVVGSGVMGERLAAGNDAVALLANAVATGAGLYVLISVLGPVSGAHFNPVVTAVFLARRAIGAQMAAAFVAAQFAGALLGVALAHAMFDLDLLQASTRLRNGPGQFLSETVATAGLVLTVVLGVRFKPSATPGLVAAYITAAYWFTASTAFANPAVTFARCWTDTFAGIAAASAPWFVLAQIVGGAVGLALAGGLAGPDERRAIPAQETALNR